MEKIVHSQFDNRQPFWMSQNVKLLLLDRFETLGAVVGPEADHGVELGVLLKGEVGVFAGLLPTQVRRLR